MITQFILELLADTGVQINTTLAALFIYSINVYFIKGRGVKRLKIKELVFFCLPYINLTFLMLNMFVLYSNFDKFYNIIMRPIHKLKFKTKRSLKSSKSK